MLSGRLAYRGRNAIDVLIQKGARDAARVTDFAPDVPEGLADVIAACLSRRPEDRPSSMRVLEVELLRALDTKAPRPVKSAVAAALAGAGVPRLDTSERSANLPLPPPPESASSSSMRAPIAADPSTSNPRMSAPSSGPSGVTPVMTLPSQAPVREPVREDRREPSSVQRPPELDDHDVPEKQGSNGWLWLVAGGTLIIAAVLLYPQLFGGGPTPPVTAGKGDTVAAKASPDVAEPDELPEPEPPIPPPPPTRDPMVIVTRAELALAEGRLVEPAGNNLSEYLKQLTELDASNEAIVRLRDKAVKDLLAKGTKELADKHAHEAADHLRKLLAMAPENKEAVAPFTEAVLTESKILRHMKAWDEILPLVEEVTKVNPKSFDAQMLRGQTLAGLGRWAEAVEVFKLATELRKKDKTAKAALAEAKKKASGK
jgi:hypothetical protein